MCEEEGARCGARGANRVSRCPPPMDAAWPLGAVAHGHKPMGSADAWRSRADGFWRRGAEGVELLEDGAPTRARYVARKI